MFYLVQLLLLQSFVQNVIQIKLIFYIYPLFNQNINWTWNFFKGRSNRETRIINKRIVKLKDRIDFQYMGDLDWMK